MEIPSFDPGFFTETNNFPFPNNSNKLRNRWNRWKHPGYQPIPESEPIEAETSFNQPIPEERIQVEPFDEIIDIPETTGLLSGAGTALGGTAVLGGAGSALGPTASIATGVLGGTIAAGAGFTAKKLYDRVSEKGAVLPDSEFIGPGNPIHIGAAKNPSEQTAKEHDINYSNLIDFAKKNELTKEEFSERVHQFDRTAVDLFEKDWQETGNWHAFAGKYGLKTKLAVEQFLGGALYPRNPGNYFLMRHKHIFIGLIVSF